MAKLHQGQVASIDNFIRSLKFVEGSLIFDDLNAIEKLEEHLFKIEAIQDNLEKYQLANFIYKLTRDILFETAIDEIERKNLFGTEDWLNSCVKKVTHIIESFPLDYQGSISLPALSNEFALDFEITPQISIQTTPKSSIEFNLASALMKARGYSYWQTQLLSKTSYINIKTKGYCDGYMNSTASNEFLSILKQFLALALILDLIIASKYKLDLETNRKIINSDRAVTPHWVMKTTKIAPPNATHIEVPPELAAFINIINLNSKDLKVYSTDPNAKTTLTSVKEKYPENEKEFNEALREKFNKISSFFNLEDSFDKRRISSALEWFLEAKSTVNQSVSLIYFCIGLEAILGDDSKNREQLIKEKLADRVAYMLGDTNSQRTKLKDDFKDIYSARSDLVHAKEPRISKQKTALLDKAESMLNVLIYRELTGLMKAKLKHRR